MANSNAMLDAVLSRVPTFGWPIAPVGQPISSFRETPFKTPETLAHPSELCPRWYKE